MPGSLNVNMVRKWWGMEDVWFMHALDREGGTHPVIFFIFANFMHDYLFNGFWFLLLKGMVGKPTPTSMKKKKKWKYKVKKG